MKINLYKNEIIFVTLIIMFGLLLRGYNINFNDFSTCFDISGEAFDKNVKKLNNFAIGPEGGWTDEELSKFQHKIKISEFSLRTETAAITAVSLMM